MIGTPDEYYDAEERTEAYNDLQDALQGNYMDDYIKDGMSHVVEMVHGR